ncbi:hypothetical protein OIO90_006552 [Microbotryomycetes sp. JL221]|nr:hypothetical protein OIO90_006552 [Microbotryomycetes sp. JL221]
MDAPMPVTSYEDRAPNFAHDNSVEPDAEFRNVDDRRNSQSDAPTSDTITMGEVRDALTDEVERDTALKRYKAAMGVYTKAKFDVFKRELETKDRLDGKRMRSRPRSADRL